MVPPTTKSRSRGAPVVGVLDIGTSKVTCVIARMNLAGNRPGEAAASFEIIAFETIEARGIKAGVVIDLGKAEAPVTSVIARAEEKAGVTLDSVHMSVTCGRLQSLNFTAHADVREGKVARADLQRLFSGARSYAEREGRSLLHLIRLGWRLDGAPCGMEPLGLPGHRISADLHAVTADEPPLRNHLMLAERSYVPAAGLVATPYASALAVTSEEERRAGVTLADLGAGTMSIAQFADGKLTGVDALPFGGGLVTSDISRALHTPLERAERIKTIYGTLVTAPSDEHEDFSYAILGEEGDEEHRTTKAQLAQIIRPRMASLLDLLMERIAKGSGGQLQGGRIVLTGGASLMTGMADFATRHLGVPVRVGRPQFWPGLPETALEPQFAAALGLLNAVSLMGAGDGPVQETPEFKGGYLERVGQWLKQGF